MTNLRVYNSGIRRKDHTFLNNYIDDTVTPKITNYS